MVLFARHITTSPPVREPVITQADFENIEPGDIVRYQTKATGHRCGVVVGRDIEKKRSNSGTKYLRNVKAPLIVTIGVGQTNRRKVTITINDIMEWRPNTTKAA
jgi:hypothetical protein